MRESVGSAILKTVRDYSLTATFLNAHLNVVEEGQIFRRKATDKSPFGAERGGKESRRKG